MCWGADGKASIERLCLSPYVEKPFNSKVIKSFVLELRSCKCFSCFGIPMFYVYMLQTFYVCFTYQYLAMLYIYIYIYIIYVCSDSHSQRRVEEGCRPETPGVERKRPLSAKLA